MAHDDDDGDSARRSASPGSFDENQELAATSAPQCAPAKSSGLLSDDSSSAKEKKTHRGPVMQVFHLLSEWISWFLRVWAKYSPLLAAVAAPMSTLLDIPALAVSGE